jgi:hypothetical protein
MAQSLTIVRATRRTLLFTDGFYGLTVKAKRLNNGRSARKQYAVLLPATPEYPTQTAIVERHDIKAALADGTITLIGREA